MDPVDDVVPDVHRVGVRRQHLHLEAVDVAGGLEGLVPPRGALDERLPDWFRRAVVHVVDDGCHRLRPRGRRVLLLQAMPRNPSHLERRGDRRGVVVDRLRIEPDAGIEGSRRVAGPRQFHQRIVFAHAHHGRRRRRLAHQRARHVVSSQRQADLDFRVLREGPGARQIERAAAVVHTVAPLPGRPETAGYAVGISQEESGRVHQDATGLFCVNDEAPECRGRK